MAFIWNTNPVFLKNGGRTAPQMSLVDFEKICDAALPHIEDRGIEDYELRFFEAVTGELGEQFNKAVKDLQKITVDFEGFSFKGFRVGANGVPYAWCQFGGDWEHPVWGMIYWDGKNFRGYLPTYGNTYNVKEKAAFGSDGFHPGPYYFSENGLEMSVTFSDEDDYERFYIKHLIDAEADLDCCDKDFSSRVEGISVPVNVGEVVKLVSKRLQKNKKKAQEQEEADLAFCAKMNARRKEAENRRRANAVVEEEGVIFCQGLKPNFMMVPARTGIYIIVRVDTDGKTCPISDADIESIKWTFPELYVSAAYEEALICSDEVVVFGGTDSAEIDRMSEVIACSSDDVRLGLDIKKYRKALKRA